VDNFNPREENSPLGDNFGLGSKFAPRGEVKNGPLAPTIQNTIKQEEDFSRTFSSPTLNCQSFVAARVPVQGCQIFLGTTYKMGKIYQITIK
jgi:hypothetical protein